MSYRLVPPTASSSNDHHVVSTQATAHPELGLHDAMRHGPSSAAQSVAPDNISPLQARLEKWSSTQHDMQQTMHRNTFGLALPLRTAMEMRIVTQSPHHPSMIAATPSSLPLGGGPNLAAEILAGTDETLDVADFMVGNRLLNVPMDERAVMERSRGM
ncbi:proteasome maturation factor UMP1 [Kockovaella imperatae]|uniref:Proteasome maturation factor UMP1 n=1 Tax=Kockovaella imperatae TaxID=4999 RepID=A0A1Y1UIE1_9TREE|nr:proteasome maturation factor UMP1 [Kockovaella imperatae]ORX37266.1 proteasome maturation factor UMP1 [Kockovaella imperatae]